MKEITNTELYATTNAAVWANAFLQCKFKEGDIDFGLMVAWFANAIETAKDHERRSLLEKNDETLKETKN